MPQNVITQKDALTAFSSLGILPGQTLIFHSSIKSIGWVEGGAKSIADALMQAVGQDGTLVAPTFTFSRPAEERPVLDPEADSCDTGAINAAVMKVPGARRTVAYTHSFAVAGRNQQLICDLPPENCPLGDKGVFGRLYELDARVLLLGVAYTHCTAGHFAEYLCDVPFRMRVSAPAQIRCADGTLKQVELELYGPKPGVPYPERDFNRAGNMLEEQGRVAVGSLGNAVLRLFSLRDFVDLVCEKWRCGDYILSPAAGESERTRLKDGKMQEIWFTDSLGNRQHTVRSILRLPDEQ